MIYGDIVNDVLADFNEVQLTSTNFNSVIGFYQVAKSAVNRALRRIYEQEQEWPFNHDTWTEVLIPLQTEYIFPQDASKIDWNSFKQLRDDTLPIAANKLRYLEYSDYNKTYWPQDAQDDVGNSPLYIAEAKDLNWIVSPPPDKAYTLTYDYWKQPLDCSSYNDIPTVPDRFRYVVIDGAKIYCYKFRQNNTEAQASENDFEMGIKTMRTQLINSYLYMQDTRVPGR